MERTGCAVAGLVAGSDDFVAARGFRHPRRKLFSRIIRSRKSPKKKKKPAVIITSRVQRG
jgi:hypothetical protein